MIKKHFCLISACLKYSMTCIPPRDLVLVVLCLVALYVTFVLGAMAVCGTVPVYLELACDVTHPLAEGLTTGVICSINSTVNSFFLVLLMIPEIGGFNGGLLVSIMYGIKFGSSNSTDLFNNGKEERARGRTRERKRKREGGRGPK